MKIISKKCKIKTNYEITYEMFSKTKENEDSIVKNT